MPSRVLRFQTPNPQARHLSNARKLEDWLESQGVQFSREGGSESQYIYLETPDGDGLTIRVSDHAQKRDEYGSARGGYHQTAYGYDTHLAADYSIAPGEGTLAGAKQFITQAFGGQFPGLDEAAASQDRRQREILRVHRMQLPEWQRQLSMAERALAEAATPRQRAVWKRLLADSKTRVRETQQTIKKLEKKYG